MKEVKYEIRYYLIKSDHFLAIPEFSHKEIVKTTFKNLQKYIESKKDAYCNHYKKKKSFGFDYVSNTGGVKVKLYKEPIIKRI